MRNATRLTPLPCHRFDPQGHRLPIAKVFWKNMRCNVLALSYRGYGLSEGSPSEKGLKIDAQTALDHIVSHPLLEKTQ